MRWPWPARKQAVIPPDGGFGSSDVLVEYDGPQLVLYKDADDPRHVALAADWDDEAERWLFADTSRLEVEALALGSITMRDVFDMKTLLSVVDFDHEGTPKGTWSILPSDVPKGILPASGAPLPDFARGHLIDSLHVMTAADHLLRFDGQQVRRSLLGFSALSQAISAFQRLWTAIGQRIGVHSVSIETGLPSTELLAGPAVGASYGVTFTPADSVSFNRILEDYRFLLQQDWRASERPGDGSDVHRRLADYAGTLEDLQLDALLYAPSSRVYLGYRSAPIIVGALRLSNLPETLTVGPVERRPPAQRSGYFESFDIRKNQYVFHDVHEGVSVHGPLSADLGKAIGAEEMEAIVGKRSRYRIELSRRSQRGEYRLMGLELLGQMTLPGTVPGTLRSPTRGRKRKPRG